MMTREEISFLLFEMLLLYQPHYTISTTWILITLVENKCWPTSESTKQVSVKKNCYIYSSISIVCISWMPLDSTSLHRNPINWREKAKLVVRIIAMWTVERGMQGYHSPVSQLLLRAIKYALHNLLIICMPSTSLPAPSPKVYPLLASLSA